MAVPAIIVAIAGALGGVLKLAENPVIAWFLALTVLLIDSGLAGFLHYGGAVGTLFSYVLSAFLPQFHISITSFQVLILVAISPVVFFVLRKSRQLQK